MDMKKELLSLAKQWEERAMEQVPAEYADRSMHNKYMRLDNEAAGLWTCAAELKELLIRDAEQRVHQTSVGVCQYCGFDLLPDGTCNNDNPHRPPHPRW